MKNLLKSFTSFSQTERMGLVGLIALILILLAVRVSMHYWVKPDKDVAKERELIAAWEKFKKEHSDTAKAGLNTIDSNIYDSRKRSGN